MLFIHSAAHNRGAPYCKILRLGCQDRRIAFLQAFGWRDRGEDLQSRRCAESDVGMVYQREHPGGGRQGQRPSRPIRGRQIVHACEPFAGSIKPEKILQRQVNRLW
jgi:hypothetical protein